MAEPGLMHVASPKRPATGGTGRGWMAFAGVMLLVSSAFNAVYGFAAILDDDYFAEEELLYGPVTVWGWLAIGIAVVMLVTALGLFAGSGIASLFGILIAAVNALVHVMAIGGHPAWSIIVLTVDGLIIYGLTVHGFGQDQP
jgi:hypothetical protein